MPCRRSSSDRRRSDRCDDRATQPVTRRIATVRRVRHLHQMDDLGPRGDERHVNLPRCKPSDPFPQRFEVLGQLPLVDRHARHRATAGRERSQKIGVRHAVLLHGNAGAAEYVRPCGIERRHQIAPGIRFRCGNPGRDLQFAQHRERLGSAHGHLHPPKRLHERVAGAAHADRPHRARPASRPRSGAPRYRTPPLMSA